MPKLLMVTNVPSMLREFLLPFAEHFKSLGWQVDAMMKEPSNAADTFDNAEDIFTNVWYVEWSRNPLDPRNFTKAPKTIKEVQVKENYDIVHVHSPVAAFVTRNALKDIRKQGHVNVIYTAHGFHFHREGGFVKNQIFKTLEKTAGHWTDHLVVINKEDEQAAKDLKIVPKENLLYMPGIGVDVAKYSGETISQAQVDSLKEELELVPSDTFILMMAEFNPGKRHRDALNALAKLNRPDIKLFFAGVGPLEKDVAAQTKDLSLEAQVKQLGYRRDIPVLLKAADALLLPSEREGLPRSILEAMCTGTAVISTQIRGVEDLLAGDSGIMTAVGDTTAIADAMRLVADDRDKVKAMGERARQKMKTFSLENIIQLHETLYARALEQ